MKGIAPSASSETRNPLFAKGRYFKTFLLDSPQMSLAGSYAENLPRSRSSARLSSIPCPLGASQTS